MDSYPPPTNPHRAYPPSADDGRDHGRDDSIAGKIAPDPALPPALGYFSPEHVAQIAAARKSSAKIRRACSVAKFSGVTTAVFAALTIVFSLTSFSGLLLGIGMAIVSIFEFRGVAELTRLDRTAPRRMALNQLAFAAMLIIYGSVSLWQAMHDPSPLGSSLSAAGSDPEVVKILGDYGGVVTNIVAAVYVGVIFAALIGPGLTAVYYYSRKRFVEDYITKTPQWILDLQRAGMSL